MFFLVEIWFCVWKRWGRNYGWVVGKLWWMACRSDDGVCGETMMEILGNIWGILWGSDAGFCGVLSTLSSSKFLCFCVNMMIVCRFPRNFQIRKYGEKKRTFVLKKNKNKKISHYSFQLKDFFNKTWFLGGKYGFVCWNDGGETLVELWGNYDGWCAEVMMEFVGKRWYRVWGRYDGFCEEVMLDFVEKRWWIFWGNDDGFCGKRSWILWGNDDEFCGKLWWILWGNEDGIVGKRWWFLWGNDDGLCVEMIMGFRFPRNFQMI